MKCPYCKATLTNRDWEIVQHIKECEQNQGKLSLHVFLGYDEHEKAVEVELKAQDYWVLKENLDKWLDFVKVDLNL